MPYYVYQIENAQMDLLKQLQLVDQFDKFKDAKTYARQLREELGEDSETVIKVMFADNQLHAEEQLLERREKPIVMEHEK
jgi:hypothetical protein